VRFSLTVFGITTDGHMRRTVRTVACSQTTIRVLSVMLLFLLSITLCALELYRPNGERTPRALCYSSFGAFRNECMRVCILWKLISLACRNSFLPSVRRLLVPTGLLPRTLGLCWISIDRHFSTRR